MKLSGTFSRRNYEFMRDVWHGLSRPHKSLPCKYLYDQRGSELFDRLCTTGEYYPTRTELGIMRAHAAEIAYQLDERVMLVEYGSGSSLKTPLLLESLIAPTAYVPVDISEEHLLTTAESLRVTFPAIEILPVVADFTRPFTLPNAASSVSHRALYFPGSTIGNFVPNQAGKLLRQMASLAGNKGGLLIGIDLQKDHSVLEAAYNDGQGVTAEFNLNLLARINVELGGDFNLAQFEHCAVYNPRHQRIEISLISLREQRVGVCGQVFHFERGEAILTEYSYKYTVAGFAAFAANHGFTMHRYWSDPQNYFAVLHLVVQG